MPLQACCQAAEGYGVGGEFHRTGSGGRRAVRGQDRRERPKDTHPEGEPRTAQIANYVVIKTI